MKRILFISLAVILALSVGLIGCAGEQEEEEEEEVIYTFGTAEAPDIPVAIIGQLTDATGSYMMAGAQIAQAMINGGGGITITGTGGESDVTCNISLVPINTNEVADTSGEDGWQAISPKLSLFDISMGGFRTEAVTYYLPLLMNNDKMFFITGAATEALLHRVVDDYDTNKYLFRLTPYNEYFLSKSVLKMIGYVAEEYRDTMGMSASQNLTALLIAEDLTWSKDELVGKIEAGLPALNINLLDSTIVSAHSPCADTTSTLTAWNVTDGHDPNLIIPIFSAACGITYDVTRATLFPNAMSVGINVPVQFKAYLGDLSDENSPPMSAYECLLDTWADGVAQTAKTATFLGAVAAATGGEYPLYTAVTYDGLFALKECLEDVGYVEAGVAKAKAADIIAWYEAPTNAQMTSTSPAVKFYPPYDGTTTCSSTSEQALTQAQKESLYGTTYTYDACDWEMPPHTSHDLCYGPSSATGLGAQWQWAGTAWKKVGFWPHEDTGEDTARTDQYGNWNFQYTGTVDLIIPPGAIAHFHT